MYDFYHLNWVKNKIVQNSKANNAKYLTGAGIKLFLS